MVASSAGEIVWFGSGGWRVGKRESELVIFGISLGFETDGIGGIRG